MIQLHGKARPEIAAVVDLRILDAAMRHVETRSPRSVGVDGRTLGEFIHEAGGVRSALRALATEIESSSYVPGSFRIAERPKASGGMRRIYISAVRDRIVERAAMCCLLPLVGQLTTLPFGVGHKNGFWKAIDAARDLSRCSRYVLRTDIKSFFPSCDLSRVFNRLEHEIADRSFLDLLKLLSRRNAIGEHGEQVAVTGVPAGCALAPLLAEVHLAPLPIELARSSRTVRYVDDLLIGGKTAKECAQALKQIRSWLRSVGLDISEDKTAIFDLRSEGVEFLGYRFFRFHHGPDYSRVDGCAKVLRSARGHRNMRSVARGLMNAFSRGDWVDWFWSAVKRRLRNKATTSLINQLLERVPRSPLMSPDEAEAWGSRIVRLEREYARLLKAGKLRASDQFEAHFVSARLGSKA